ncbi:RND transporter, Hydrophobe/Amphiphile Efflux-1 (HAE1)/Heavy Metal Efflux (HME) family, permease protein [Leptospira fainei serovar Hurstbridge str. BUT 6]|uniref:RND transporter, Hydrophobe/Amphiphile Efflux-1 (HAE1)/Heavy Metal Efflux (HME) family, permease protein n=2 Tax=Leptospira fainei TaxID=48782 RepID=S3VYG0_9LEPT|nr:RND transporter, Hydrophobe/Amphiphile Efflux-1 (HAE1)/Heavy Metal Efflux (HME) family, permease protein [Leptospira fainei serovar Hurstbridge str. BUT 6]
MVWSALILFGFIALSKLKINLMPELEFPKVTIVTHYSNSSAEEVESLITKPISDSIGTIGGVESVNSESMEGMSVVTVQFSNHTSLDYAIIDVREKIDLVRDSLPQDASKPLVTRFDPSQSAFQEIVIFPKEGVQEKDLRGFLSDNVKVYFERIEGLAAVQFSGGYKKEISIEIDSEKMNSYSISLFDVRKAISLANVSYPAGTLPVGDKDYLVRAVGEFKSIESIGEAVVGNNAQGIPIRLASFSNVRQGYRERTGIARYNGKDCVIAYLYKESGRNSVEISERVKNELEIINQKFGREISAQSVYDESKFISESISGVTSSLISGMILAFLVLVFLLRNVKSPLILLTVIPASLFSTLLLFYLFGISLNMMSLGGMALGIGMLFDTSNVVFSAIERNLARGAEVKDAAVKGTLEVTGSVVSATLTTVIVFLPIIFFKSMIGIVFGEMALAITLALLMSLVASLTLIPMLTSVLYGIPMEPRFLTESVFKRSEEFHRNLLSKYEAKLSGYLDRPKPLFLLIGALFSVSVLFLFILPMEFIPRVDTGEFSILVKARNGSGLEATSEITRYVESLLLKEPVVKSVISRIGFEEDQIATRKKGNWGTNRASIRVVLKENSHLSSEKFISKIRSKFHFSEEVEIHFENSGDVLSSVVSPDSNGLSLEILGEDLSTLSEIGHNLKSKLAKLPGIRDARISMDDKSAEYALSFDTVKSSIFNLSNDYLSNYLRMANYGSVITKIKLAGKSSDVRLFFQKQDVNSLEKIMAMSVQSPQGNLIQLSQIGKIERMDSPLSIVRTGNSRVNLVTADVDFQESNAPYREVKNLISKMNLPDGYRIRFSGEQENIDKSFGDLTFSFILAIVLIYMLLASQFESLLYSLIMICTIPLMFIGVFPALFLFGKSLNVSSFMGLVLLLGVVVDNAALYYEYVHLLSKENIPLRKVITDSGKIVLRPILMNNATTILGLLPIMLELQKGTEFQSPMAIVVIVGLLTSFFFSLYLIPVLFFLLLKNKRG